MHCATSRGGSRTRTSSPRTEICPCAILRAASGSRTSSPQYAVVPHRAPHRSLEQHGRRELGDARDLVHLQELCGRRTKNGLPNDERRALELLDRVGVTHDDRVDERVVEAVRRAQHHVKRRALDGQSAGAREPIEQVEGCGLASLLLRLAVAARRRLRQQRPLGALLPVGGHLDRGRSQGSVDIMLLEARVKHRRHLSKVDRAAVDAAAPLRRLRRVLHTVLHRGVHRVLHRGVRSQFGEQLG
mmetsp:Transcript_14218/g.36884  ORF Transcript_14218/g.36884 Transcript_14218/m.36884 type:complete len:244 (-) Transcript_14218:2652-3383(-)